MKFSMLTAASFSSLLFFAGCERRITNANIDAVKTVFQQKQDAAERTKDLNAPGMTPKEVESILGKPDEVETFKIPLETQHRTLLGTRYHYRQHPNDPNSKQIILHFLDDKLVSAPPYFDEPASEGDKIEAKK